ncbi:hypothetical protein [Serinicoccus chungangensis]|uniref:hypothetical protein n=1 Tax=Serinicoccus chungangensis TaxID=767452 RepID=UPI00130543C0|nr:hypothetical protein [Serinicoccus chungangensis]
MSTQTPHPGSEHLVVLQDRETAEAVAAQLEEEGFLQARVQREAARRPGRGEADRRPGWVVHISDSRLPDEAGGAAYEALRERFTELARVHDGWYDEPGDPRPATR